VTQWSDGDPRVRLLALARPAVAAAGPAELPLLEATVAAAPGDRILRAVRRTRRRKPAERANRSEDMLGFGWDESIPAVTMAALGAAQAVLVHLAAQAGDAVRDGAAAAISDRVKALLRRRGRTTVATSLDADQLRRVRQVAVDKASELGLDRPRAELVADAIVGRLAAPEPESDEG
jgi:hypothetical protein